MADERKVSIDLPHDLVDAYAKMGAIEERDPLALMIDTLKQHQRMYERIIRQPLETYVPGTPLRVERAETETGRGDG
jgi:hypothetical protein